MQLERFKRDRARQSVGGPQVLSAQYLSSLERLELRLRPTEIGMKNYSSHRRAEARGKSKRHPGRVQGCSRQSCSYYSPVLPQETAKEAQAWILVVSDEQTAPNRILLTII